MTGGGIELERTVDSIRIGVRHRHDLGDLGPLIASIRRQGLVQPITITPDGTLICGARRLAAIKQLGYRTVNVWVRSGVSDRLGQLLAEQDDNELHKPLTQLEAAGLYRELKALMAEDASRRQEATRFHPTEATPDGAVNLTAPEITVGETRVQAARMITGRDSHTTLERVARLQDLAADPTQPEPVRTRAQAELSRIQEGGKVFPAHLRVNTELSLAELDRLAADPTQPPDLRTQAQGEAARIRHSNQTVRTVELERLAADALARIATTAHRRPGRARLAAVPDSPPVRLPVRAFTATWDDLDAWWTHYDPVEIGVALTQDQWDRFEHAVAGTLAFIDAARTARIQQAHHTA